MSKKEKETVSRRSFIKHGSVGTLAAAVTNVGSLSGQTAAQLPSGYDRFRIFSKIGDTLIPTDPGNPGYRTLEPYNITAEVMKGTAVPVRREDGELYNAGPLSDQNLALFNSQSAAFFGGKSFLELSEDERAEYLTMIVEGVRITDPEVLATLQSVYTLVRYRVFVIFYQNYPQHMIPRDDEGVPILSADNTHQITNPNQPGLVTGWDIAGWKGPLTWEEEEERRAHFKKVQWREDY